MAEIEQGKIKWFSATKGYGFISWKPGSDVFMHISNVIDLAASQLVDGLEVAFVVIETPKGLEAQQVRAIGVPDSAATKARSKRRAEYESVRPRASKDYRFLNPYNFVRYLDKPRPQGHVLGDCPPPSHDRYVGLTGRIVCELKAETPLFVSDSHAIQDKDGHRTYRFFQVKNEQGELEPALPATSLRGMVRSVFEAVTNSCFAVFDGSQRLEFREKPEYGNKVKSGSGIVNALPRPVQNGRSTQDGEIVLCHVAKVGAYYEGREQWKNALGQKPNGQLWRCGDWAIARAKRFRQGYVVRELSTSKKKLQPLGDGEEYVEGWLKITGKGEGTSKRSEFLFLNPDRHRSPGVVRFGLEQMNEYNLVLAGQRERDDLPMSPQSSQLALDNLVWVETRGKGKNLWAQRVVRIQIPRTPYKYLVGDLLPGYLHRCSDYDTLCPACRLFGWVHEDASKLGKKKRVAYAGRVRFSHGKLLHGAGTVDDPEAGITLAILSTPKPTITQFYLLKNGRPDGQVTYDDKERGAHLRGRKFYRHHGAEPSRHRDGYEYKRATDEEHDGKDDQNRTVRGVLKPKTTFKFTIEFENLAPAELGALLWSLQLEAGMHHRLGYAKPLGFGSVTICIKTVKVLQLIQRFTSLKSDGWAVVTEKQRGDWVKLFKSQMMAAYGSPFEELPNIQDLKALAGEPDVAQIHYPRLESEPQVEGENFRWFVENKRQRSPHALDLAVGDRGLPLNPKG